jgi:hypothetical protein
MSITPYQTSMNALENEDAQENTPLRNVQVYDYENNEIAGE